jgi:MmyB-like transcription regulator ligand binding domain
VLGLTEDERRYLHRLAHGHVGRPRPLADEATAEQIVRQLVATAADSPYPASLDDDPRLHVMVGELRERSPEFGPWWDSHDVREHRSRLRRFRHPELGEQVMRLVVVRAPEFEPCIVAFHLPTQDLPAG